MSKILIYSTHNYTVSIASCLKTVVSNIIEVESEEEFIELTQVNSYDVIILDSSNEDKIYSLAEVVRGSQSNAVAGILYLVPGKVKYSNTFSGIENAPVLGISKPFSPIELRNICTILLNNKQQRDKLLSSMKEIEHFAVMAAHDLKTPLKNVYSYASLLGEELGELSYDSTDSLDYANTIMKETKKLITFVNDIFEYSRAGNISIESQKINIKGLVGSLVDQVAMSYPQKKIEYTIVTDSHDFVSDPSKLGHIFQNLIENAIKYTDQENVKIEVGHHKTYKYESSFYVKDNGPGIRAEDLEKIFLPFRRGKTQEKGTGMGLAIVKKLVKILGGEIWVESVLGKGAIFYFTINEVMREYVNEVAR